MTALRIAFCCLAAGTYLTFMWGVWRVFVERGKPSGELRVLQLAAAVSAVAEVAAIAGTSDVTTVNAAIGAAMYVGSLWLFTVSARTHRDRPLSLAFSPDRPQHLVRAGPYRWVRHPFYTSYLLSYVAGLVLSGDQRLWAVVLVMAVIYVRAARVEERKFARSGLRSDYDSYRSATGMLLPNPVKWMRSHPSRRHRGALHRP